MPLAMTSSVYLLALLVGSPAARSAEVSEHISDAAAEAPPAGPESPLWQPTDHAQPLGQETSLLQSADGMSTYGHWSFMEGSFGLVADDAPTWCKNETQLTWAQRKERMQQHNTLQWAKKMVKTLQDAAGENVTIPGWMGKLVSDDERRGRCRWAVQESRRLKAEGKETPRWMEDLVAEDAKWANRWAACKVAQLKAAGEEPPAWMVENGRRGVLEAATEKVEELQEEIDQLDTEREQEAVLVDARGDAALAGEKMLAMTKAVRTATLSQQAHVLEGALEELDRAEVEMKNEGVVPATVRNVRHSMRDARYSAHLIARMLERKVELAKAQVGGAAATTRI